MSRAGIIAVTVFAFLLLAGVGAEYRATHPSVPPGVAAQDCLRPAPPDENPNDRFARLGGRIARHPNAQWKGHGYTATDIAQGRDLTSYDKIELRDPEPFHPWQKPNPILAQFRLFLWEHWQNRKRAYLVLTMSSVDHTGTSHVFVEPDDAGRWRVYRRVLDRRELIDEPTAYSMEWVIPNGWNEPATPLPAGQKPDPLINELEFRDICGEKL